MLLLHGCGSQLVWQSIARLQVSWLGRLACPEFASVLPARLRRVPVSAAALALSEILAQYSVERCGRIATVRQTSVRQSDLIARFVTAMLPGLCIYNSHAILMQASVVNCPHHRPNRSPAFTTWNPQTFRDVPKSMSTWICVKEGNHSFVGQGRALPARITFTSALPQKAQ